MRAECRMHIVPPSLPTSTVRVKHNTLDSLVLVRRETRSESLEFHRKYIRASQTTLLADHYIFYIDGTFWEDNSWKLFFHSIWPRRNCWYSSASSPDVMTESERRTSNEMGFSGKTESPVPPLTHYSDKYTYILLHHYCFSNKEPPNHLTITRIARWKLLFGSFLARCAAADGRNYIGSRN